MLFPPQWYKLLERNAMNFQQAREDYIRELDSDECMWHWEYTQIAMTIHKQDIEWGKACKLAQEIMEKVFSPDANALENLVADPNNKGDT